MSPRKQQEQPLPWAEQLLRARVGRGLREPILGEIWHDPGRGAFDGKRLNPMDSSKMSAQNDVVASYRGQVGSSTATLARVPPCE